VNRVFLLSPASCSGKRAKQQLLRAGASGALASRLRDGGAPIGEVFSFVSALYFRGKLTYAQAFAATEGVRVITTSRGLLPDTAIVTDACLREFAAVRIDSDNARYREPLERTCHELAAMLDADGMAVLLGSIATDKYTAVLQDAFGSRLRFPAEFVGRGDMSRGGLMLRSAAAGVELTYVPLEGTARRGPRPPRLGARAAAR